MTQSITEEAEELFLSFFKPNSARRLSVLLQKGGKGREKFRQALHTAKIDKRFENPVNGEASSPHQLAESLKKDGAPSEVYVFSSESDLDNRKMPIEEAIGMAQSSFERVIVLGFPKKIAYFRESGIKGDFLLRR